MILQVNRCVRFFFQTRVNSYRARITRNVKFKLMVPLAACASPGRNARMKLNPYVEVTATVTRMSVILGPPRAEGRWRWNKADAVSHMIHYDDCVTKRLRYSEQKYLFSPLGREEGYLHLHLSKFSIFVHSFAINVNTNCWIRRIKEQHVIIIRIFY